MMIDFKDSMNIIKGSSGYWINQINIVKSTKISILGREVIFVILYCLYYKVKKSKLLLSNLSHISNHWIN